MMKYSLAKVIVSLVLVVWYFAMPQFAFGEGCGNTATYWTGHVLYPLSHANVWHLMANILCLWMIPCGLHLSVSYLIAVLCSFLPCFIGEATCGFSGVLFAIVGMSWGRVKRFRDMLWRNKWFLIIPMFIPHVNALLHIYCLMGGYLVGYFWRDNIAPHGTRDWL